MPLFLARCGVMLDSSKKPLEAEKLFIVNSSCPQQVGFFAYWSQKKKTKMEEPKQGSLTLCCFPIHMKTELKKEISSEHCFLLCGEAKSERRLAKGDQAFFSLSNGLTLVDEGVDIDYTPVEFTEDFVFRSEHLARFEGPTIEFFKREDEKEEREKLCSMLLHPVAPFENRSPLNSREKFQSQNQRSVCEPSTSEESSIEESAEIKELRKATVTLMMEIWCKEHIGTCWYDLGAYLKIPESELDNIQSDHVRSCDKGLALLRSWRTKKGNSATVGRLLDALISIKKKEIAENLLDVLRKKKRRESQQKDDGTEEHQEQCSSPVEDIVRKEKRREIQQKGDGSEERQELCSSPVEEDETRKRQTRERGGSPDTTPSTSEEVNASETRDLGKTQRRSRTRSGKRKSDAELKRVARLEKVRKDNLLKLKSRAGKPPRRQQNTRRNEPSDTRHRLLMELTELKELIERIYTAESEKSERMEKMTEKVREMKEDFLGAS